MKMDIIHRDFIHHISRKIQIDIDLLEQIHNKPKYLNIYISDLAYYIYQLSENNNAHDNWLLAENCVRDFINRNFLIDL